MESRDTLQEVRRLYDKALYKQAWECGKRAFGALEQWPGIEGQLLAGRLAWNFGARQLGDVLVSLAHRADRSHPEACYHRLSAILCSSGPLAALRFFERHGEMDGIESGLQADWLARHGSVLASLRDFERAEAYQSRAEELAPERPWIAIERAHLLERQDERKQAVRSIQRALKLRPNYRPAVQHGAQLLQNLNRGEQALDLLRKASRHMEAPNVIRQLIAALMEVELYDEARTQVEALVRFTPEPLRSEPFKQRIEGLLSDIAAFTGDHEAAHFHASRAGSGFFEKLSSYMAQAPPEPERRILDVEFVKQNFVTCAPATLAALANYWGEPVDHEALANDICYDGTPDHVERNWVETHGFAAREFKVTWDSTRALLRAGVPFTVTSGGATWAHLQAIIGFDERRGTVTVLEPGSYARCEYLGQEWLDSNASFGPRGLAFVPKAEAARMSDLELPDAALYDIRHAIRRSLADNRREQAAQLAAEMATRAPEHALTVDVQWALGNYDSDWEACLAAAEKLLSIYEDEPRLQLAKLGLLRSLAHSEQSLSFLREIASDTSCDPVFVQELASELMQDARHWEEARLLLESCARRSSPNAEIFSTFGRLASRQSDFESSSAYHRFASCLAPTSERAADDYFESARVAGRVEEAVEHLRARNCDFGDRSGQPAITLYHSLVALSRRRDAFEVLDAALERRPDDTDLALFAAESRAVYGKHAEASELLESSRERANRNAWLRAAAEVARQAGEPEAALSHSLELAERMPLNSDAHRGAIHDLRRLHGPEEALAHVEKMLARAPDHLGIQALGLEWLGRERSPRAEEALVAVLQRHPLFAWARRELALLYSEAGRVGDAKREAELALEHQPLASASHSVLAEVLAESDDCEGAHLAWRRAIELDVDQATAIQSWIASCRSNSERREVLAWVGEQLECQVVYGPGLSAYRQAARATMDPEEALPLLERILAARPELRDAWSEVVQQLLELGRFDEAAQTAERATQRYPYDATAWADLARVQRSRHDRDGASRSLARAIELAPRWLEPVCEQAEVLQSMDRLEEAASLLRRSIEATPRDARLHGYLADILRQAEDLDAAVGALERAIEIDPAYEWAWSEHRRLSRDRGEVGATSAFGRQLTELRSSDPDAWLALARCLSLDEANEEALGAVERAVELAERNVSAHDMRARLLAGLGRTKQALRACEPSVFGARTPKLLRGRRAWVEANSGNRPAAIDAMRAVVEDDNGFYWGWNCLVDWYREAGRMVEAEEAATWLTRLAPATSSPWCDLADLRLDAGDRDGAKQALRRAVDAEPNELGASLRLIDLHLEDREVEHARDVIAIAARHGGGPWVAARELRLARLAGDEELGERAARAVFTRHCHSDWPVTEVLRIWHEPIPDVVPFSEGRVEAILDEEIEAGRACGQAHFYRATSSEPDAAILHFLRCVELEPGWDAASRALGDALQRVGSHESAIEVLEALVERSPEAENEAFLADACGDAGNLPRAIEHMRRSIERRPDREWYWQRLEQWLTQSESEETVQDVAKQLSKQRPMEVGVWLAVVAVCRGSEDASIRIGACRKAIRLEPFELDHHLLHVDLLCEVGNYDGAIEACRPDGYEMLPLALRERAAAVEEERGDLDAALARLRALLADEPTCESAWSCGARWLLGREQANDALRWTNEMCDALPQSGWASELRGRALRLLGDHAEAFQAFQKAHLLDPGLIGPPLECFDQLHEEGDIEGAAPFAAALLRLQRDEYTLARGVQLAAATGDEAEALELFAEVCATSQDSAWPVSACMEALASRGWHEQAEAALDAAIASRRVDGQAVAYWIEMRALPGRGRKWEKRIARLVLDPELGGAAVQALMRCVSPGRRFERLVRKLDGHLRGETWAWGYTGFALARFGEYRRAAAWLGDWQERSGIDAWMLDNLVIARRSLGDWDGARAVGDVILENFGSEQGSLNSQLWQAFDDARTAHFEESVGALNWLATQERGDLSVLIEELAWVCLRLSGISRQEGDTADSTAAASRQLGELVKPVRSMIDEPRVRLAYLATVREIAARRGGFAGWGWKLLQTLRVAGGIELSWWLWYLTRRRL